MQLGSCWPAASYGFGGGAGRQLSCPGGDFCPKITRPRQAHPLRPYRGTVRKKIGECLIQAGLISEDDLQTALAEHKRSGERVGSVLVRLNLATEKQITKALAYQLGFPYVSLGDDPPDASAIVL